MKNTCVELPSGEVVPCGELCLHCGDNDPNHCTKCHEDDHKRVLSGNKC